jgi:integrase/recombinase XerC
MPPRLTLLPRLPRYLTQDELQRFFAVIVNPRDQALFTLVYHHGLRVGEVALLRRSDVDLARQRIIVWRLKHGAWSAQPFFTATSALLARHLATIPADPDGPLFPGRDGPLKKRQIQFLFARYRDEAGLPRHYTCHSLRHSIATHLLDAGAALEVVQDRLGHQSIRSTSIYARITDHHRAALFRQLESSPWIVQPEGSGATESTPPPPAAP